MKIDIYSCLKGSQKAEGLTVIIDVFRASNSIIAILARGAEFIIPTETLEEAYQLKEKYPDYLLFGERNGLPPADFDSGNSPALLEKLNLPGKRVIFTTSAGTKGITKVVNSDEILVASFANITSICNYLRAKNAPKVSLVPVGLNALQKAVEDEECAKYLKSKLIGKAADFELIKKKILASDGARRLLKLNQDDDLEFALKIDLYNIIPKYYPNQKQIKITNF